MIKPVLIAVASDNMKLISAFIFCTKYEEAQLRAEKNVRIKDTVWKFCI